MVETVLMDMIKNIAKPMFLNNNCEKVYMLS